MLTLNNHALNVAILDPGADQERFGARYCTGGYIYQVTDHRHGDLLSGPTYPYSFNWFDGQGIPDSFRTHIVDAQDSNNEVELGIGIGLIRRSDNQVQEYCKWEITEGRDSVMFKTQQTFSGCSLTIQRTLHLMNRSLVSDTALSNPGTESIPVNWFPHPFFPLYQGGECCRCNIPIRVPENPGYELSAHGFICQKNLPWDRRGYFQELECDKGQSLTVIQRHPKLGMVSASFSYFPTYFPIWGNKNTFSFEPYLQVSLAPADTLNWSVIYDF